MSLYRHACELQLDFFDFSLCKLKLSLRSLVCSKQALSQWLIVEGARIFSGPLYSLKAVWRCKTVSRENLWEKDGQNGDKCVWQWQLGVLFQHQGPCSMDFSFYQKTWSQSDIGKRLRQTKLAGRPPRKANSHAAIAYTVRHINPHIQQVCKPCVTSHFYNNQAETNSKKRHYFWKGKIIW